MEPEFIDLCDSEEDEAVTPPRTFPTEVIAECSLCTMCFNTTTAFIDHMKSYHRIGKLHECSLCHKFFMSEKGLVHHMETEHSNSFESHAVPVHSVSTESPVQQDPPSFTCEICGDKFKFAEALEQHNYVHIVEKKYSVVADHEIETPLKKKYACSICFKKFLYEEAMLVHKRRKHILLRISRTKCGRFTCKTCGRAFPGARNLLIHEAWHRRRGEVKAAVPGSSAASVSARLTRSNLRNVHFKKQEQKPSAEIVCEVCERSFFNKRGLSRHLWVHAKNSAASQQQGNPNELKEDNTIGTIGQHKDVLNPVENQTRKTRSAANFEQPYRCKFCKKRFRFCFHHQQHVESHPIKKHHICDHNDCGERFGFKSSLQAHKLLIHSRVNLFHCPLCAKPFSSKILLYPHHRSCSQVAEKTDSWRMAKEVCENLQPILPKSHHFTCNICDRMYKSEQRLLHHILLDHPSEEFPFHHHDMTKLSALPPLPPLVPVNGFVPSQNRIAFSSASSCNSSEQSQVFLNQPSASGSNSHQNGVSGGLETQEIYPPQNLLSLWES